MGTWETNDEMITRTNKNVSWSLFTENAFHSIVYHRVLFDWLDKKVDII